MLAGRLAAGTDIGLANVAKAILAAIDDQGPRSRAATPIFAGRLTKKVLFEFPEGSFLLSNVFKRDMTPEVAQRIPRIEERAVFWKKLSDFKSQ